MQSTSSLFLFHSNAKPFKGSDDAECRRGGQFFTLNTQILRNAEEADKALKMPAEDRLKLVVHLQPSDSEEESEEDAAVEMMDLDRKLGNFFLSGTSFCLENILGLIS